MSTRPLPPPEVLRDGLRLALGGMWGVLLAEAREASPAG